VKLASFLYDGFYSFFDRHRFSTKPDFSAWAGCTLACLFYLFAAFSLADGAVAKWTGQPIPWGLHIQIGLGIALVLGSDWRIEHSWFGVKKEELPQEKVANAEFAAFAFLIGSWVAFMTAALFVYVPDP
jgi:hypothetical protein